MLRALRVAIPPSRAVDYPLSLLIHALKVCGRNNRVPSAFLARGEPGFSFGEMAIRTLTENSVYGRLVDRSNVELLRPSEFGVFVHTQYDNGFAREFASPHVSSVLAVLAETGVSSRLPLEIRGRREHTVEGIIADEAARITEAGEIEWATVALTSYLAILAIGVVTSALCASAAASELSEVVAAMRHLQQQVLESDQFYVKYSHEREGKHVPAGSKFDVPLAEVENAMAGGAFYFHFRYPDQPDLAKREVWAAWRDDAGTLRTGNTIRIQVFPSEALFDRCYYWVFAGIDVFQKLPLRSESREAIAGGKSFSDGFPFSLPRAIEDAISEYHVRPDQETLFGEQCEIVERPGRDIIWVDPQHGYLVRKRILFQAEGMELNISEVPEIREVKPGLWLPDVQVYTRFNRHDGDPDLVGKVMDIETNRVKELKLEGVDSSTFIVPPKDGGLVIDGFRKVQYTKVPADTPLEERVATAVQEARSDADIRNLDNERSGWTGTIVAGNVALILIGVIVFLVRRR